MRGSITRLLRKQGCGFILGEDGCEVYFDQGGLNRLQMRELSVGQWVEYELAYGPDRLRAMDIRILRGEQDATKCPPTVDRSAGESQM